MPRAHDVIFFVDRVRSRQDERILRVSCCRVPSNRPAVETSTRRLARQADPTLNWPSGPEVTMRDSIRVRCPGSITRA